MEVKVRTVEEREKEEYKQTSDLLELRVEQVSKAIYSAFDEIPMDEKIHYLQLLTSSLVDQYQTELNDLLSLTEKVIDAVENKKE